MTPGGRLEGTLPPPVVVSADLGQPTSSAPMFIKQFHTLSLIGFPQEAVIGETRIA